MPKVSIIVPTFNRVSTIHRVFASCFGQTYKDFELIIVDDGSTDETAKIVAGVQDLRLRYFRLNEQQGVSVARNFGVKQARGDFLAFHDSDDLWHPSRLLCQMEAHEHANVDVSLCSYLLRGPERSFVIDHKAQQVAYQSMKRAVLSGHSIGAECFIFKKTYFDSLGGFDPSLKSLEDYDLSVRIFSKIDEMKYLITEKILFEAFCSGDSLSRNIKLTFESLDQIRKKHLRLLSEDSTCESKMLYHFSKPCLRDDHALDLLKDSLRLSFSWKALILLICVRLKLGSSLGGWV